MFVGFGPAVRGIQYSLSVFVIIVIVIAQLVVGWGERVGILDVVLLPLVLLLAFQLAQTSFKGAEFGQHEVVVRGQIFERVIPTAEVSAITIPGPPSVLKVIAKDGGYAATQVVANLVEMPPDKRARQAAVARLHAWLAPHGVYVSEQKVPWAETSFNHESASVVRRVIRPPARAWWLFGSCVAAWLLATLL